MYEILTDENIKNKVLEESNRIVKKIKSTLFSEYDLVTKTSFITEDAKNIVLKDKTTNLIELDYNFLVLDSNFDNYLNVRLALESSLVEVLGEDSFISLPAILKTKEIKIQDISFIINFGVLVFDEQYYSLITSGKTTRHAFLFPIPNSGGYLEHLEQVRNFIDSEDKITNIYLKTKNGYKDDINCPYQSAFCYMHAVNLVARDLVSKGKIKAY